MNTQESSICDLYFIFLDFVFGISQLFHSEISQKIILLPKIQIRFHEDLGPIVQSIHYDVMQFIWKS